MDDEKKDKRNPLLIPATKEETKMTGCPKCKANNYTGRNIQGTYLMSCLACGNKWQGGFPQVPEDPTVPKAPIDPADKPSIELYRNRHGEIAERRRRVDQTPAFRKGLPIPDGEDE